MNVHYQEFAPGAALQPFVECFWRLTTNAQLSHLVVPDGCLDIIYSRRDGLRAVGAMTRACEFPIPADESVVGVRFHPGAAGLFLRFPAAELTDATAPLEEIWGARGRGLHQRLANAAGGELPVLSRALPISTHDDNPVRAAIRAITRARGLVHLDSIAAQANLSRRQFRRRCLDETGLTPRQLCRVLRFRNALGHVRHAARHGWAQLALECGYCDQAHFIHEFRAFSGSTPAAYARREHVPFLQFSTLLDA